jgi:hypothetical protein
MEHLTITRHRFSVTQGEVSLTYNGTPLGRYGDAIRLVGTNVEDGAQSIDGWAGHGDVYWIDVAQRSHLLRAIALVKAEAVAPQTYAFASCIWNDEPGRYYLASARALGAIYLGDGEGGFKTVPELMADGSFVELESWWTPQHQQTYRDKRTGYYVPARWVSEGCTPFDALAHHYERVTVDLQTGKVIVIEHAGSAADPNSAGS